MKTFFSLIAILLLVAFENTRAIAQTSGAPKMPRIGLLASEAPTNGAYQQHLRAFLQGLKELGYVEGENLSSSTDMRVESSICCRSLQIW